MAGFQDGADLDCGASRQFLVKLAGLLEQLWMATNDAEIGARWGT